MDKIRLPRPDQLLDQEQKIVWRVHNIESLHTVTYVIAESEDQAIEIAERPRGKTLNDWNILRTDTRLVEHDYHAERWCSGDYEDWMRFFGT